jgi:hypothetical protein
MSDSQRPAQALADRLRKKAKLRMQAAKVVQGAFAARLDDIRSKRRTGGANERRSAATAQKPR